MEGKMKIAILTNRSWSDEVSVSYLYEYGTEGLGNGSLRRRLMKDIGMDGVMASELAEHLGGLPFGAHVEWTGGVATLHELDVG
jgi:hypothetical protein